MTDSRCSIRRSTGKTLYPENNCNWPQLNVKAVNKAIDKAELIDNLEERNRAWGDVDTMINEQAPAVPWVWDNPANIALG